MKILMLNHNLRERGTWHRAWQIGRELARRGYHVTLWTAAPHHYYRSERREEAVGDGWLVEVETPSWAPLAGADDGWGPLDVAWRITHTLFCSFDLCYAFAHPPNVWLPAWVARRVGGLPLLYDWCDWYVGGVFPKRKAAREAGLGSSEPPLQRWTERREIALERRMPRLAGRVTVISEHLRAETLTLGRRPEDVLLLPNGANLDGIRPRDAAECRCELGLPAESGPLLGYAANYHPDQALLLGAVARAASEVPGLKLLAAGAPFDAGLLKQFNLTDSVLQLGQWPADRIDTVLGAADALALPLDDTPHNRARVPFKFTDYLAAGRPVVTSPVGDLAQWFAPGTDPIGAAAPPTAEAYGAAIAGIMSPTADRIAMGAAARALAEREFDWRVLIDRLEEFVARWLGR